MLCFVCLEDRGLEEAVQTGCGESLTWAAVGPWLSHAAAQQVPSLPVGCPLLPWLRCVDDGIVVSSLLR